MTNPVGDTFKKFVGQVVGVHEKPWSYTSASGKLRSGVAFETDADDPTLRAVESAAVAVGLSVRVWLPGMAGIANFDLTRLNVHIQQDDDGDAKPAWRIVSMDLG